MYGRILAAPAPTQQFVGVFIQGGRGRGEGSGRGLPWEKLSRKPRRRGLATFTGYRSHPGPIGTVVRADDLVAVRRVALAPIAIHTTFGDHGQLSAGRRHLNFRRQAVPHELQLLLLRVRAIEEAEGVALLEVLAAHQLGWCLE